MSELRGGGEIWRRIAVIHTMEPESDVRGKYFPKTDSREERLDIFRGRRDNFDFSIFPLASQLNDDKTKIIC